MILADTSVWIDYLNGNVNEQTDGLDNALVSGTLLMGDLILLEILQGIRSDKQYNQVKSKLSLLDQHAMLTPETVFRCAEKYRFLSKKGITVRKSNDVIIASFCIDEKISLLYSDRDFVPFEKYLKLRNALL